MRRASSLCRSGESVLANLFRFFLICKSKRRPNGIRMQVISLRCRNLRQCPGASVDARKFYFDQHTGAEFAVAAARRGQDAANCFSTDKASYHRRLESRRSACAGITALGLSGEGTILARSPESPLIVAIEKANLRALVIGFALMDSDLPLRVAFPVLVHNALEWFQPSRWNFQRGAQSGSAISLRLPAGEGDLELRMPSARKKLSLPRPIPAIHRYF